MKCAKCGYDPQEACDHLTLHDVPAWIREGATADYHAILGGPVTIPGVTITSKPFLLGGQTPCVFITGKTGCVSVWALTEPQAQSIAEPTGNPVPHTH